MPTKAIEFGNRQQSGQQALGGASPVAINVVTEKSGAVRRRPVVQALSGISSAVIDSLGIEGVWASNLGSLYAIGGSPVVERSAGQRQFYRMGASGATNLSVEHPAASRLEGFGRPVFAETEMLLVVAGGERMMKIELLNSDKLSRLGGDPPKTATHVLPNSSRLLANASLQGETTVQFSGVFGGTTSFAGAETWTLGGVGTSGFFSAEARADPVVAIYENTNEIFVWGTSSLQVFQPDSGSSAYAAVGAREFGLPAPYSVIKIDQQFAFLDHHRRFMLTDGRVVDDLGQDIQQTIDDMTTVSDCWGARVKVGPVDCLVWTFPTEGRTFAYQVGGGWSQWQGTNSSNGWGPWPVNCHHGRRDTKANIVGTTDGKVGELVMGSADDFGTTVTATVETGRLTRGTLALKKTNAIRVHIERGTTTSSVEPLAFIQFSDTPEVWSDMIPIGLGLSGDRRPVIPLQSLGTYRDRAWRFTFSASEDLVLAGVEEDYEVLGN